MRTPLVFAITIAVCLAGTHTVLAEKVNLPTRAAGKWKIDTTMDEGKGPKKQTLTMCVDEQMEKTTAKSSLREHQANCSKYEIKKIDSKVVVDAVCRYGRADVESRTEMEGDFQKSFTVKISSTTVHPTREGQSRAVKRTINQAGTHLGTSCGDLKPGEAMGTDGTKILVQ